MTSRAEQLRGRMGAAARRDPGTAQDLPAAPKTTPYKGTFELSRQDAKRLRSAAFEHDTSITRLVEAAALVILDDPAAMRAALRVAERLARERS